MRASRRQLRRPTRLRTETRRFRAAGHAGIASASFIKGQVRSSASAEPSGEPVPEASLSISAMTDHSCTTSVDANLPNVLDGADPIERTKCQGDKHRPDIAIVLKQQIRQCHRPQQLADKQNDDQQRP